MQILSMVMCVCLVCRDIQCNADVIGGECRHGRHRHVNTEWHREQPPLHPYPSRTHQTQRQRWEAKKKADFNQEMTRVGPIMEKKSLGSAWSNSDCMQLPSNNLKNKTSVPKRQTNGGPCKFCVWVDPIQLASVACCHNTSAPEKQRVGRREADVPFHILSVRMRPEEAPVFVLFQAKSRLFPPEATSPPLVHIAEAA